LRQNQKRRSFNLFWSHFVWSRRFCFRVWYVFLLATAVVAVAHLAKVSWLWTAVAAAGLHIFDRAYFSAYRSQGIKRADLSRDHGRI